MTTNLEWATAIGTVGATVIAALSALAAVSIATRQRFDSNIERRLAWATDLLAALEAMQQHTNFYWWRTMGSPSDPPTDIELKDARARFNALLLTTREDLPLTRKIVGLEAAPDMDSAAQDHLRDQLQEAPVLGPPDQDIEVRVQRAEIKAAIDDLYRRLEESRGLLRRVWGP